MYSLLSVLLEKVDSDVQSNKGPKCKWKVPSGFAALVKALN